MLALDLSALPWGAYVDFRRPEGGVWEWEGRRGGQPPDHKTTSACTSSESTTVHKASVYKEEVAPRKIRLDGVWESYLTLLVPMGSNKHLREGTKPSFLPDRGVVSAGKGGLRHWRGHLPGRSW